jgi:hypothetical protein
MTGFTPAASGRIFISYRREETAYAAGWLYDRLADHYGSGQVFKDVDSIQLGDDFVDVITRAVGSCDVLLALIGPHWLTATDERGRRRLDNPGDFVRLEIEAALTRRVRVIPILVDDARIPDADELPESLSGLVRRQALELSPSRFESDTGRLLRVLDWTLVDVRAAEGDGPGAPAAARTAGDAPAPSPPETREAPAAPPGAGPAAASAGAADRSARTRLLAGVGVGVVLVLAAVAIFLSSRTTGDGGAGGQGATEDGAAIAVDATPVTSPDGLRLSGLAATSPANPPAVGDTVVVTYSLTNTTGQEVRLASTFVGARDQADENRDVEVSGETVLAQGETVKAEGRVRLESPGTWRIWPCYELSGGTTCPDAWQAFSVTAG